VTSENKFVPNAECGISIERNAILFGRCRRRRGPVVVGFHSFALSHDHMITPREIVVQSM